MRTFITKLLAIGTVALLGYVLYQATMSRPYHQFLIDLPNTLPCATATPPTQTVITATQIEMDWCGAVYWSTWMGSGLLMFAPLYVVLMALILAINIVRIDHRDFSLLLPGARRRELLRRAAVTNFHALNPYEFEELMCELLRAMGYKDAQVTQRARDGGFDVRATSQRLKGGQMLIECKRYAPGRKISVELVRSFHGVLQKEQAYEGWFVTTSSFTKPAEEHARAVPYIRLIDGDTLAQLYQQHILAPNDKQQQTTTG